MRLALLVLLFTLAACDSGGDADAIVGTWRLDTLTETVRVTSQTSQVVPDLSAEPNALVTSRGARTANLDVVILLTGGNGGIDVLMATDPEGSQTGAQLDLIQIPGSAQATLTDFGTGEQFSGFFGNGTVIARSGGRFTVPPLSLNGAGAVTVGGSIVYPEITLTSGRPIEVRPFTQGEEGTLTVTFESGGRFTARSNGPSGSASATGTWERLGAEQVRLTSSSAGVIEPGVFKISVAGGVLELKGENLDRDAPCGPACIRQVEPEVFAEPGSLSAVSFVTTFRFRTGG